MTDFRSVWSVATVDCDVSSWARRVLNSSLESTVVSGAVSDFRFASSSLATRDSTSALSPSVSNRAASASARYFASSADESSAVSLAVSSCCRS